MPTPQPQSPQQQQADLLARQPRTQQPRAVSRGSLIVFPYTLWKHDPVPCVMVSSIDGYMLKGINLHYLTFGYIQRLLAGNAGNPSFSYYNIKADQYIVGAFRSYLVRGIMFERSRIVDAQFLLKMMAMIRSFDPLQIRAIRQEIERQLSLGTPQLQPSQMQQASPVGEQQPPGVAPITGTNGQGLTR